VRDLYKDGTAFPRVGKKEKSGRDGGRATKKKVDEMGNCGVLASIALGGDNSRREEKKKKDASEGAKRPSRDACYNHGEEGADPTITGKREYSKCIFSIQGLCSLARGKGGERDRKSGTGRRRMAFMGRPSLPPKECALLGGERGAPAGKRTQRKKKR